MYATVKTVSAVIYIATHWLRAVTVSTIPAGGLAAGFKHNLTVAVVNSKAVCHQKLAYSGFKIIVFTIGIWRKAVGYIKSAGAWFYGNQAKAVYWAVG